MTPHVTYRDIPRAERKRFAAEVFRLNPRLRNIQLAGVVIPVAISVVVTDSIASKGSPFLLRLGISISTALILCALVQELVVRPRLKTAIEKLKNA